MISRHMSEDNDANKNSLPKHIWGCQLPLNSGLPFIEDTFRKFI